MIFMDSNLGRRYVALPLRSAPGCYVSAFQAFYVRRLKQKVVWYADEYPGRRFIAALMSLALGFLVNAFQAERVT